MLDIFFLSERNPKGKHESRLNSVNFLAPLLFINPSFLIDFLIQSGRRIVGLSPHS